MVSVLDFQSNLFHVGVRVRDLDAAMADPATRTGLLTVAPSIAGATIPAPDQPAYLTAHLGAERIHTLGRWGPSS